MVASTLTPPSEIHDMKLQLSQCKCKVRLTSRRILLVWRAFLCQMKTLQCNKAVKRYCFRFIHTFSIPIQSQFSAHYDNTAFNDPHCGYPNSLVHLLQEITVPAHVRETRTQFAEVVFQGDRLGRFTLCRHCSPQYYP